MSDFYIVLPSSTKTGFGAADPNTSSHYRVQLPYDIDLPGQWQVALVSITYPYTWNNIPGGNASTILIKYRDSQTRVVSVRVRRAFYGTIQDLFHAIKTALRKADVSMLLSHLSVKKREEHTPKLQQEIADAIDFSYDTRVTIHIKDTKAITEIYLSPLMQYMLGYTDRSGLYSLNQPENLAKYPPDLSGGIDSLYVYCDLIQPQIVGDTMTQLLRQIPIRVAGTPYGHPVTEIFTQPHYLNVIHKKLSTIEVYIKNDSGENLLFNFGKSTVKLHFVKKSLRL